MAMLAFYDDSEVKEFFVARVRQHVRAGQVIQTRGCYDHVTLTGSASGVTAHSYRPDEYENQLGIPGVLALLEDVLGSGMSLERSAVWPEEFLQAVPVGAELTSVLAKFVERVLGDSRIGVISRAENEEQRAVIQNVANLYSVLPGLLKLFVQATENANEKVIGNCSFQSVEAINAVNTAVGAAAAAVRSFIRQDILWVEQIVQAAAAAVSGDEKKAREDAYANMADVLIEILKAV